MKAEKQQKRHHRPEAGPNAVHSVMKQPLPLEQPKPTHYN